MSESIMEHGTGKKETVLTEIESKALLLEAGIPVNETELARSEEEAIALSKKLGFPVVLKIVAPGITHKSDVGGVQLGLRTEKQVVRAYRDILSSVEARRPKTVVEGMAVQRMVPHGVEVIVGMTKDPQFGPVLMFGLGGILVEVLKDVSFRIVPLEKRDACEMIREIKGYALLTGYRGRAAVDISSLEGLLLKISEFVDRHPEIKEMDLNPIFAYSDGVIVVDSRIVLETSPPGKGDRVVGKE